MTDNTINSDMTMGGGASGTLLAGRYRVVKQLGQGGMGSVWLAEDTKLDGFKVAIKMLPSVLVNNKRAYVQVKAEALVSLKLSHPNIVAVRAFEEENGNPFLVMDYIDGQTLDDYLAEKGKLTEEETVKLLKPVAAALDYAHSQGVVHRDVKPGNVMIRKDGTPFVLDFGIAREIQETMTHVTGKLSSGTLLYMSPEQLHGDAPKPAQDIYSFAAMAYECLRGEPPFSRGGVEDQIKHKTPEPLLRHIAICRGVMAGLAKSPEVRPATCAAVLSVRSRVPRDRAGDGVSARKARIAAVLLGVVALATLIGVGGWFWREKVKSDKLAAERAQQIEIVTREVARQQAEAERIAAEKVETERRAKAEAERIAEEKRKVDEARIVAEKTEAERKAKESTERLAEDKVEAVRATAEESSVKRGKEEKHEINGKSVVEGQVKDGLAVKVHNDLMLGADGFLGLKLGDVYAVTNSCEGVDDDQLRMIGFKPTVGLANFDAYVVCVTPRSHKVAKIFACAKKEVCARPYSWDCHYLVRAITSSCGVKGVFGKDHKRPTYKFDLTANRHIEVCLTAAYSDYQTVILMYDDLIVQQGRQEAMFKDSKVDDAVKAFENKEWERGMALSKGVENDDARIQFYIGYCYNIGCAGIEKNMETAAVWCRKSAENGYAKAQNMMGLICEKGLGVETNEIEAVKWFKLAAENGEVIAQKELAQRYAEGRGVVKNAASSFEWYLKAANQGDAAAQNMVGLMYGAGNGVAKDPVSAFKWNLRAAEQGDSMSQCMVGYMYANGEGVAKDMNLARQWWQRSAEQGNQEAKDRLKATNPNEAASLFQAVADMLGSADPYEQKMALVKTAYDDGKPHPMQYYVDLDFEMQKAIVCSIDDPRKAIGLYKKMLRLNNVLVSRMAAEEIALIYEMGGENFPKNDDAAVEWWKKAAKFGGERAKKELQKRNISW